MKTLDEVINALEICGHDESPKCPYFDTEHWCCCEDHMRSIYPLKNDALHYLKELRDMIDIPMEYFESGGTLQNFADTSQITCPKCHSEFVILPEANNPLTWDELKSMEGKPVWVEALLYKQWAVIAYIGDEYIRFEGANLYAPECRTYMGADNGWKAYRKEKTDGQQN